MLFISFWKMTGKEDPSKIAQVALKLFKSGKYPVEGAKIHHWLITPGGKGIVVSEADSIETVFRDWLVWTKEYPGIFEYHEVHPALDATKVAELALEE